MKQLDIEDAIAESVAAEMTAREAAITYDCVPGILEETQRMGDLPLHVSPEAHIADAVMSVALRARRGGYPEFYKPDPWNRDRKRQRAKPYYDRMQGRKVFPVGRRGVVKRFLHETTGRRVEAQQEIEQWLRRRGVRWHTVAKVIAKEYRGNWDRLEDAMVRFGHVKVGAKA